MREFTIILSEEQLRFIEQALGRDSLTDNRQADQHGEDLHESLIEMIEDTLACETTDGIHSFVD
jgi:hypothetical protein